MFKWLVREKTSPNLQKETKESSNSPPCGNPSVRTLRQRNRYKKEKEKKSTHEPVPYSFAHSNKNGNDLNVPHKKFLTKERAHHLYLI